MKLSSQLISLALAASGTLVAPQLAAETLWSDNSLSVLHNVNDYEGWKDKNVVTLTVEHASASTWGDVFFFMDRHNGDGIKETYAELTGRLNVSQFTGEALSLGPVSNVYLTAGTEHSKFDDNYMGGVSLDWQVPGFMYFKTSFFQVNNDTLDNDQQLTVVYGAPFSLGNTKWVIDGYIDWSTAEADHASDFHFNPQIRMDLSEYFGAGKGQIEAGIEYSYWNNKYGVASLDESTVSAIIKLHL